MVDNETIREDFDALAAEQPGGWSHNACFHGFLLRQLPKPCRLVVDFGCGQGELTALLAEQAEHVLGLDLSPTMVARARERTEGLANVTILEANLESYTLPPAGCDCIVSVATLHHLPLEPMLRKLGEAIVPGGRLVVLDLYRAASPSDLLWSVAAWPAARLAGWWQSGPRPTSAIRAAWRRHGQHDTFSTLAEVRHAAAALPGAIVRRHLYWRYSLIWDKPLAVRAYAPAVG